MVGIGKHTPGPWETDAKDHDEPYLDLRIRSGRRNICTVWIDDAPVPDYNAEQAANARLIAAAPDLLEALQWALAELNGQTRYDEDVADQQIENCYARAEAAIAKATGQ